MQTYEIYRTAAVLSIGAVYTRENKPKIEYLDEYFRNLNWTHLIFVVNNLGSYILEFAPYFRYIWVGTTSCSESMP